MRAVDSRGSKVKVKTLAELLLPPCMIRAATKTHIYYELERTRFVNEERLLKKGSERVLLLSNLNNTRTKNRHSTV